MRPKREPIPRAKEAWVWLGGTFLLGILGAGVVGAAVLLWENVDIRQLAPGIAVAAPALPHPTPARAAAADGAGFRAVLFNSAANRAYFPDAEYHGRELDRWRDLLADAGATVRDATGAEALRGIDPDEVLVLAESPCLAGAELAAIRGHVAAGGSVVANWAVGVRDGSCAWRGWRPLLDLTGAEEVQELPTREGLFMTVPSGTALSAGFDPGTRIELRPDPSLAVRAPGPRVYWSDWALNPAPDEGGFGADVAAIGTRTGQGGRTAWFGMRLGQAATPADSDFLGRLIRNGVLWSAGATTASIAAWPDAARAAVVFTLDVEEEPRNALAVADLFEAEEIPGTFFAVTRLVKDDPELGVALSRAGEIGSQTVDHSPLGGLTAQDQAVRLRRSWSDIEGWIGDGPAGLRPPEEAFDATTLRTWALAGGEYVLVRNEARTASPEFHTTPDGPIVLLPRLLKDDYNLVVQDRTLRNERVGQAFLRGTRKLRAIGGLAVVAGHTQIMQSPGRLDAFRMVADSVRAEGDWWIAGGTDVARWWSARAGMDVRFVAATEAPPGMAPSGLSDLAVTAGDRGTTARTWIEIVLPTAEDGLLPLVDGASVPFDATEWGIRVPIGAMPAGTERRVSLVRPTEPRPGA